MTNKQSAWRSPWIVGWASLLVLFFVFSGVRVYLAVTTNPGLVDENYYERGEALSRDLRKRAARNPGWNMEIEAPDYVDIGQPTLFGFRVSDREGRPVRPDAVIFHVYRPADARLDFSKPMREVGPGHYTVEASFPLLGVWDILVSSTNGEDEYNVPYRISAGVK